MPPRSQPPLRRRNRARGRGHEEKDPRTRTDQVRRGRPLLGYPRTPRGHPRRQERQRCPRPHPPRARPRRGRYDRQRHHHATRHRRGNRYPPGFAWSTSPTPDVREPGGEDERDPTHPTHPHHATNCTVYTQRRECPRCQARPAHDGPTSHAAGRSCGQSTSHAHRNTCSYRRHATTLDP